jgi:hypothetical protein
VGTRKNKYPTPTTPVWTVLEALHNTRGLLPLPRFTDTSLQSARCLLPLLTHATKRSEQIAASWWICFAFLVPFVLTAPPVAPASPSGTNVFCQHFRL